ncbi:MAG TPA: transglutaminase domain-containing protein [Patescibacteria group bacterium]
MRRAINFLFFLLILVFSFYSPSQVFADNNFITTSSVLYQVDNKGTTNVTQNITLQNTTSGYYATSYSISLVGTKPINPQAFENSVSIPTTVSEEEGKTTIKITFPDAVVGKGNKRQFSLTFKDNSLAVKTGEIWEITLPKLSDQSVFNSYTASLVVPPSFGSLAYISPEPSGKVSDSEGNTYTFSKEAIASGVTAAFGQFQVFTFNLVYHLENPLGIPSSIDVAIPPDTAYQKVNYSSITPTPTNVKVDDDGNWIATFKLKGRERVDLKVAGAVQIFASARPFSSSNTSSLDVDKKETDVWQTKDPLITDLASKLKNPRAIYDYVVSNLTYDYSRVTPNVVRLGASAALRDPKSAICTEFTDSFIALARAAGIPAREINGYAYTENPKVEPLSLVSDVLHAWPEYWDAKSQTWIPVDPTWGSTTGGVDYFSKLDLRHFAFVIHGSDSKKPYPPGSYKLGPNPQKDVFVSFGQLPALRASTPQISISTVREVPFADMLLTAHIKNPGPVALYNQTANILFDGENASKKQIGVIPPYANYDVPISVPYSFIGKSTPNKVGVVLGTVREEIPTYKTGVIISNLAAILIVIFVITFAMYVRFIKGRFKRAS